MPEQDAGASTDDAGNVDAGTVDAGSLDAGNDGGVDAGLDGGTCLDRLVELGALSAVDGGLEAHVMVDTFSSADDNAGSCVIGGGGGKDVAVHFTLAAMKLFSVWATSGAGSDATLTLKSGTCASLLDVACADTGGRGAPEAFQRVLLGPGEYSLIVDEYDFLGNGSHDVRVLLEDPPPVPVNDGCASAQALVFINGVAVATGDTFSADNSNLASDGGVAFVPWCSDSAGTSGRDVVFAFTVPPGAPSDARVTVAPVGGALEPVVYVMAPGSCSGQPFDPPPVLPDGGLGFQQSPNILACAAAATSSPLMFTGLTPGTYFVWVDGRQGTAGPFELQVTLTASPSTHDQCVNALEVLDGGLAMQLSGLTRGATDDSAGPCGYGEGKELYYAFTTSSVQRLSAVATPDADGGYRLLMYLFPATSCQADAGVALAAGFAGCAAAGAGGVPVTLEVSALDAGRWILAVDGLARTSGPFDLALSLSAPAAPPANAVCSAATTLTTAAQSWGQLVRVEGTTWGASNNHDAGGCLSVGPDVAYRFVTSPGTQPDGGGRVNAKATVWSNNTLQSGPSLFLRPSCDAGLLACSNQIGTNAIVTALGDPPATARVLWVDGASGSGGPFTLQLEMANAAPLNETCGASAALSLDTSVTGSTLGAANDYQGYLPDSGFYVGDPLCRDALPGPEVVYRFTAGDAGIYTVWLHPDRAFDPGLVVTSGCASGACLGTQDLGLAGEDEVFRVDAGEGSTWYIFVDSYSSSSLAGTARGGYVLGVTSP